MEIEFKYKLPSVAVGEQILEQMGLTPRLIHMDARYFDTPARTLRAQDITLRMREERMEGGASPMICCCKAPGKRSRNPALKKRVELECEASDILSGIEGILAQGCEQADALRAAIPELTVVAGFRYVRREARFTIGAARCSICVDAGGFLRPDGTEEPFCELELELVEGKLGPMEKLMKKIVKQFNLEPQPLSKYARALAAGKAQ